MELQRADSLEKKLARFKMRAILKAIKSGTLSQMPWTDLPFGLSRACSIKAEQHNSKTDVRFGYKQTFAVHQVMSALPPIATLIAPTENPIDSPCSHRSFRIFDFQPRL